MTTSTDPSTAVATHHSLGARIDEARERLAASLGELQARMSRAKTLISPRTYLENRWVQVGFAVAAGYLVGRGARPKLLTAGPADSPRSEGMLRATLRSALMAAVGATITRLFTHPDHQD